ncbi:MAG TPA: iron ABC transporter permease, partial [Candidatus Bathyarchaeota archaeon]|nr:iron ABC transporter permease [Candidatus Bathyarchaeota archaeon]
MRLKGTSIFPPIFPVNKLISHIIVPISLITIFSIFIVYPILVVIAGVFIVNGKFTLANLLTITYDPFISTIIINTLIMGGLVTLITLILAVPYTYILNRYDIPFKSFFLLITLLPFISPPYVGGLGYINMLGRQGVISLSLLRLRLIDKPLEIMYAITPIINPMTGARIAEIHWGLILICVLTYFPLMALTFLSALQNVDESLEEEAYILGSKPMTTFFKITLKSAMPGLISGIMLVFISFVDEIGIPLIVGYRNVMAVAAYEAIEESSFYYTPRGYVLSLLMITIGLLVLFLGRKYISLSRYVSVVKGAARYRKIVRIRGIKRILVMSFMILMSILLSIGAIGVIIAAFAERWYLTPLPTKVGLKNFGVVFDEYFTLFRNSIIYSITSMIIGIIMSALISYIMVRMKISYSSVLDYILTLPLVVPGVVIGIGTWAIWRGTPLDPFLNPITIIALVIAFR